MKKAILFVSLAICALIGLWGVAAYHWTYSEGYRVGNLIKFSHKGYIFKTWEGQIDLGFLAPSTDEGASPVATRLWDFSVRNVDDKVIQEIDKALSRNGRVKLHYEEKLWQVFLWGDTKYFVTKVESTE
jgi:hypothetical protein